ncbi:MAG TPA: hypothetical protein VGQ12_17625 [Candidatus Angelobacter sp.]|nr:hypothetical protein [Candidatus Angelobacter sp.]
MPVSSLPLPKNEEKSFRPGGEAPGQHELLLCDAGHHQPPSTEGLLCSVYLPKRDTCINQVGDGPSPIKMAELGYQACQFDRAAMSLVSVCYARRLIE